MTRVVLLGFVMLAAACGSKSFESLCANQVPAPAACNTPCNPSPGAQNSCPPGYHCSPDGKCDLVCTQGGSECGDGYACTADGYCVNNGSNNPPPDMSCPQVHFAAKPTTPSIQLLIDRSGSMLNNFQDNTPAAGDPIKYDTVATALVGPQGVVTQLQDKVYFGATLFSADPNVTCPTLKATGRAKNNLNMIAPLINNNRPIMNARTPTPPSIDAVVADFMANPVPADSLPVIVLATDGLPNECGSSTSTKSQSVIAARNAFMHGIRLYILAVGDFDAAHVQAMANAGAGVQPGQPDATAYVATNPTELSDAFQSIIRGVVSCDLKLDGQVNQTDGMNGTVRLNGMDLTYGRDWTLDPDGITIHILGTACNTLKASANPVVDATFDCGAIIF